MEKLRFLKQGFLGTAANTLGNTMNFAFGHPIGIATTGLMFGQFDDLLNSTSNKTMLKAPTEIKNMSKAMSSPTPMFESGLNNKFGSVNMKKITLKDYIVNRMKKTSGASVKQGSLGVTVTDKDVNFVKNITSSMSKTASIRDLLNSDTMKGALNALNVLGLGYVGGSALKGMVGTVRDALKRQDAYHQMFEEFPNLAEIPREQVDKYWGVLNDYAPKLTINPLVAGQFIENMATFGMKGIDHNVVGQLAQISNQLNQASGAPEVMKMLGGMGTRAFSDDMGGLARLEQFDNPNFNAVP